MSHDIEENFLSTTRHADKIKGAASINNVPDVKKTLLWYQNELGMQIEFAFGDPIIHGSIRAGNTSFHLQQSDEVHPATSYMTFYVDELDALYSDIEAHDIKIISAPEIMPWGMRAFMITDCNGALVMFADPSSGE